MRTAVPLLATVILACAIAVAHGQQDDNAGPWQTYDTSNGEWRSYAGDIAGTKYSPLDQITAQNFSELEVACELTSVDTFLVLPQSSVGVQSLTHLHATVWTVI